MLTLSSTAESGVGPSRPAVPSVGGEARSSNTYSGRADQDQVQGRARGGGATPTTSSRQAADIQPSTGAGAGAATAATTSSRQAPDHRPSAADGAGTATAAATSLLQASDIQPSTTDGAGTAPSAAEAEAATTPAGTRLNSFRKALGLLTHAVELAVQKGEVATREVLESVFDRLDHAIADGKLAAPTDQAGFEELQRDSAAVREGLRRALPRAHEDRTDGDGSDGPLDQGGGRAAEGSDSSGSIGGGGGGAEGGGADETPRQDVPSAGESSHALVLSFFRWLVSGTPRFAVRFVVQLAAGFVRLSPSVGWSAGRSVRPSSGPSGRLVGLDLRVGNEAGGRPGRGFERSAR